MNREIIVFSGDALVANSLASLVGTADEGAALAGTADEAGAGTAEEANR